MNIEHNGETLRVVFSQYLSNGNTCMSLLTVDNEPYATATTNPGSPMDEDFVAIKNWTENTGIDASLIKAGLIEEFPVTNLPSGMVRIPIYRLTEKAIALRDQETE